MTGLLVRIGADLSKVGGGFNGPVDSETGEFVYVPIREDRKGMRVFMCRTVCRAGTCILILTLGT